ncbi:hypothetical protein DBL02_12845 [Acinetobacter oleivorans]|uniref:hypothetical protein n=1 Tax=Acinetobacter oleivorans TaxID=1148157 RepID=UPI000D30A763|nr:hypothetical protein [Acinetobacter oleivorans]PTV44568.1 hypothetical protein DBL02_12845 [Acinetobacter oleivorans]
MKNFNVFQIFGIGVALLLICVVFSLIGKHVLDLEGDYLSAAATLFAAVIAFILYQDWREQYKVELLEKIKEKLFNIANDVEKDFQILNSFIYLKDIVEDKKEFIVISRDLMTSIEKYLSELEFYDKLIIKYKINFDSLNLHPLETKKILNKLLSCLIENFNFKEPVNSQKKLQENLKNYDYSAKLSESKMAMNSDIQTLILKFSTLEN